ncbi:Replication factor C, subunit RFC4 [Coemansia sp. RSA 1813]|nr:Replication factor C, subunit RFC4 [Coemansia sp. RSA 1646]KAJ1773170.1 Replication factor C, subunit RFC4 [Coemansia sp. RSA 1843]KAJ2092047.1 Replication factor C, subunit RFC4 [Coemansia sp. RSA 986]KAJ2216616.1 Replication factor C, subunit RFC4 [Coemansia sp. RSA 487]KAJ2572100.1 Replication factor C, subunit RFC4 [Coemansia sp. RSA 1813]
MSPKHTEKKAEDKAIENLMVNDSLFAFGTTFVAACAVSAAAQRFWPGYRRLPISAKTILILAPSMGAMYVRGEQAALVYRRSKYVNQLDEDEREAHLKKHDAMNRRATTMERTVDYITKNRWSILGCTWLAGMSGSIYHLYRKKGMTPAQKAVQARMYAQAITIIGILSTAGIASLSNGANDRHIKHNSAALEAALAADTRIVDKDMADARNKAQASSAHLSPSVIEKTE